MEKSDFRNVKVKKKTFTKKDMELAFKQGYYRNTYENRSNEYSPDFKTWMELTFEKE
jgi:hypothetical protein